MIPTNDAAEWLSAPTHAWHNQQLAGQHSLQNTTAILGHNVCGSPGLELLEAPPPVSLNYGTVTAQVQDQHSGSTSSFGTSEAASNSVPLQQAQGSMVSYTETGRDAPTQDSQILKALVPDQVCTCATCLDGYTCPPHLEGLETFPERNSWTFGCRMTGCQWTTKIDERVWSSQRDERVWYDKLREVFWHEKDSSYQYGQPGGWRCREAGCKFVTKRCSDFKRHSSSKHCIKPKRFECPALSCKYHQIGFTRMDKLKSHYQNAHEGKLQPGKPNQAIKPKASGST